MAVVPLPKPTTEATLSDMAKTAPLHPYLLPSTLSITSVSGGMSQLFPPYCTQSSDHVTSMVLSPSSITALLSSVQNRVRCSPPDPLSSNMENKVELSLSEHLIEEGNNMKAEDTEHQGNGDLDGDQSVKQDDEEVEVEQCLQTSFEMDEPSSPEPQTEIHCQRWVL